MIIKKLVWIGSSRPDLKALPDEVQDEIGYSLYQAQLGHFPDKAKSLKGFKGVFEIVSNFNKNTYRSVYATKLEKHIMYCTFFRKNLKAELKHQNKKLN